MVKRRICMILMFIRYSGMILSIICIDKFVCYCTLYFDAMTDLCLLTMLPRHHDIRENLINVNNLFQIGRERGSKTSVCFKKTRPLPHFVLIGLEQ